MASEFIDWCARLEETAPAFPQATFGNERWNMVLGETPGDATFFTLPMREDVFREQLFRFRISFLLPVTERSASYRPDRYAAHWRGPEGEASATLVFPPGRAGAVWYFTGSRAERSQLHFFTRDPSDPESALYPDHDPATRTFSFRKQGIVVKMRLRFDAEPEQFTVDKGWQATRVGVRTSGNYACLLAFGADEAAVDAELQALERDRPALPGETTAWWNRYFNSCPLVRLHAPVTVEGPCPGVEKTVSPEALIRRQLWLYYWCLASIVEAPWCPATPLQLADRRAFNQAFSNDNTFGIELLSLTNQAGRARAHLVNLVHYLIDGQGKMHWSISVHGHCTTFEEPNGVPAIAHAVAHYVRVTGDISLLDADAGGMTVWDKLRLYDRMATTLRDTNGDGLVEWNHIWETGEDNKNSPFFKKQGLLEWRRFYQQRSGNALEADPFYRENVCPVTAVNEQAFHLWGLDGMAFLAEHRGESPLPYQEKAEQIHGVVAARHWDEELGFYCDYDVREGRQWSARNLSGAYFLFFERDTLRARRIRDQLADPAVFRAALFPSLAMDDPLFDPESYWAGAAWPREQGFVALGLARQGFIHEAFEAMVRTLASEEGFHVSETLNPLCWPLASHASIAMTMASINQVVLLELCGLRTWEGPLAFSKSSLPLSLFEIIQMRSPEDP